MIRVPEFGPVRPERVPSPAMADSKQHRTEAKWLAIGVVMTAIEPAYAFITSSDIGTKEYVLASVTAALLVATAILFCRSMAKETPLVLCGPEDGGNHFCCGKTVPAWFATDVIDDIRSVHRCEHCCSFGEFPYPNDGESERRYRKRVGVNVDKLIDGFAKMSAKVPLMRRQRLPLEQRIQRTKDRQKRAEALCKVRKSRRVLRAAFAEQHIGTGRIELSEDPPCWIVQRVWPGAPTAVAIICPVLSGADPHEHDTLMAAVAHVMTRDAGFSKQLPAGRMS